ncbi:MAG: ribbon-helix-helix domain-containing protein [Proteobacteria bacterium]|nr:ribbon-helix-helix domain-containing protein [Pseudomonadota bacterium]
MDLSIQIDPILEAQIAQEAKRLGMSESDFVKDLLEQALGFKNPYKLLQQVRSGAPIGDPHASEHTGEKFKAKLHAQRAS